MNHYLFLTLLVPIDVSAGSTFSTKIGAPGDTPWDLESATFTPSADTAADAANKATIVVSKDVTTLASWTTDNAVEGQGALTNGQPVELALQGRGASIYGAGHKIIDSNTTASSYGLGITHVGTGAAVKGNLLIVLKRGQRIEPRE